MSGLFKVFLEALLGAFTRAFQDWRADNDRIRAHQEIGAKAVENAGLKGALDAVKTKAEVADDLARLGADERRSRLQRWAKDN